MPRDGCHRKSEALRRGFNGFRVLAVRFFPLKVGRMDAAFLGRLRRLRQKCLTSRLGSWLGRRDRMRSGFGQR